MSTTVQQTQKLFHGIQQVRMNVEMEQWCGGKLTPCGCVNKTEALLRAKVCVTLERLDDKLILWNFMWYCL